MVLPHNLRRKSEKLALAFEYVHERFSDLPTYANIFKLFGKFFSGGVLLFLFVFTINVWQPALIRLYAALKPKPLPEVHIISTVYETQRKVMLFAEEKWQGAIRNFSIPTLTLLHQVPEFLRTHPEIFTSQIQLELKNLWSFQTRQAHPLQGFIPDAARDVRRFVLPFTQESPSTLSRLGAQIVLLRQLINFNTVDLPDFLDHAIDRGQALEEFLLRGQNLEQSSRSVLSNIAARRTVAASRDERLQGEANAQEAAFLEYLNTFAVAKTEQSFSDFVTTKQHTVTARAEAGLLEILQQKFTQEILKLRQKLAAIEQNKTALIANVTVTSTPGVDLGLIR